MSSSLGEASLGTAVHWVLAWALLAESVRRLLAALFAPLPLLVNGAEEQQLWFVVQPCPLLMSLWSSFAWSAEKEGPHTPTWTS